MRDEKKYRELYRLIREGEVEKVKEILNELYEKENRQKINDVFDTSLGIAANHDLKDLVYYILGKFTDIDFDYYFTFMAFCRWGDLDSVKKFVEEGKAKVDWNYNIPLLTAVLANKIEVAEYLLEKGADPHDRMNCMFYFANDRGQTEMLKLLEKYAKPDMLKYL